MGAGWRRELPSNDVQPVIRNVKWDATFGQVQNDRNRL